MRVVVLAFVLFSFTGFSTNFEYVRKYQTPSSDTIPIEIQQTKWMAVININLMQDYTVSSDVSFQKNVVNRSISMDLLIGRKILRNTFFTLGFKNYSYIVQMGETAMIAPPNKVIQTDIGFQYDLKMKNFNVINLSGGFSLGNKLPNKTGYDNVTVYSSTGYGRITTSSA